MSRGAGAEAGNGRGGRSSRAAADETLARDQRGRAVERVARTRDRVEAAHRTVPGWARNGRDWW